MKNKLKVLLSLFLIYEPIAYVFFIKRDFCRNIFSYDFCATDMIELRILLFLICPIILGTLFLMWSGNFSKAIQHHKNKQKTKKIIPITKQEPVSPKEALRNYWLKATNIKGTAQRSEYWIATFIYSLLICLLIMTISEIFKAIQPDCFEDYLLQTNHLVCFNYKTTFSLFTLFITVINMIPSTTLKVRRWHDIGCPGFLAILPIILFIFSIIEYNTYDSFISLTIFMLFLLIQFVAFCLPSKTQNNSYRKNKTKKPVF